MTYCRRRFLHFATGAASLAVAPRPAGAQIYPSRPATMIVPFAAGGPSDVALGPSVSTSRAVEPIPRTAALQTEGAGFHEKLAFAVFRQGVDEFRQAAIGGGREGSAGLAGTVAVCHPLRSAAAPAIAACPFARSAQQTNMVPPSCARNIAPLFPWACVRWNLTSAGDLRGGNLNLPDDAHRP
jgi:hypothetical protein